MREKDPDALLLNAGDYYQGTMWYTFFKYRPVTQVETSASWIFFQPITFKQIFQFSNLLNYTVMALGNHDFDDGTSGLQPFVDQVTSTEHRYVTIICTVSTKKKLASLEAKLV